jgi:hypothetical protein
MQHSEVRMQRSAIGFLASRLLGFLVRGFLVRRWQVERSVLLRLGLRDFAERQKTIEESENGANLIEDHGMHDAKAGEKRSTDANDIRDDNQTPTPVDVPLEILGDITQAQKFSEAFLHETTWAVSVAMVEAPRSEMETYAFFSAIESLIPVTYEADG